MTSENEIKAGDVVRLKSDALLMTVGFIENSSAVCYWFYQGELRNSRVNLEALEKTFSQTEEEREIIGSMVR